MIGIENQDKLIVNVELDKNHKIILKTFSEYTHRAFIISFDETGDIITKTTIN